MNQIGCAMLVLIGQNIAIARVITKMTMNNANCTPTDRQKLTFVWSRTCDQIRVIINIAQQKKAIKIVKEVTNTYLEPSFASSILDMLSFFFFFGASTVLF